MAGNADTIYVAKSAATLTNPTSASTFVTTQSASKAAILYLPSFQASPAVLRFVVQAWGTATSGTTSNFLATLQYGTSITAGSNTNVVALTNRSYVSTSGNWTITLNGIWDSTSQKITGVGSGLNLATIDAAAAITAISSVSLVTAASANYTGLGFCVSALFGTSNAANVCNLSGLTLEVF